VIDKVVQRPSGFAYNEAGECQSTDTADLGCRSGYEFVDENTDIQFWEHASSICFQVFKKMAVMFRIHFHDATAR
jgi:hypothetical protein